jgi:nucleoside-diphosphate-sugar epimerase
MNATKDTILITGASGLIGTALVERLARDYRVVGFDIQEMPHVPEDGAFFGMDLTSDDSVADGLEKVRMRFSEDIRSVIHLAAYYDFSGEPSPKYDEITVQGTGRLLQALQSLRVRQFQFSSTLLVHAPTEPGKPINEDCALEPKWDYPQSKETTEKLILSQRGSIPALLLRIAGVYDDYCHSIPLAQQIQRIYERQLTSYVYPGDLDHGQSFVHLDDLVDVFVLAIENQDNLPPETPLLIGEPKPMSYGELQKEFGRLLHGEDWTTRQILKAVAKTGAWVQEHLPGFEESFIKPWMIDLADDHYELDISRAENLIHWQPRHSLRETLPKMITALNEDPVNWYEEHHLKVPSDLKEEASVSGKG